ncbi:CBS domain-containing protein [Candidatus Woesearchaeota archaeon]|nr:CBS domain-containing protein [Candidatus Woesearchaeota archaeon]
MPYEINSLKQIRKQIGLTQTEFAREAGVSQSLVAKIEAGKIDPTYSKVKQIFEALDRLSKRQELSAKEVMQKGIITAKPADRMVDTVKLMHKKAISQVPVIDGKNIVGLVTEKELLEKIGQSDVHMLKVKDVMAEPPPIVSEDTKISVLKSLISYYPILLVAKKGEISGVVTKSDIISRMV